MSGLGLVELVEHVSTSPERGHIGHVVIGSTISTTSLSLTSVMMSTK